MFPIRCFLAMLFVGSLNSVTLVQVQADDGRSESPRAPISIKMIQMDLSAADQMLRKHDLNDDGVLSQTEWARPKWDEESVRRFDLDRDGRLQHVEIALKAADERLDHGIVQMDATLAERYTRQYDADLDGQLSIEELRRNNFTDAQDSFDTDSDGKLSQNELIRGLAFERRLRDELGIKGCDQGGAMKLINRGDRNGDRQIDEDELELAGLSSKAMDFDRSGDGKMSISELAEMLADRRNRLGLTPSDQIAARGLMRRFDRDRDGIVASTDLPGIKYEDGQVANWDVDGNGKITESEIEKYFGNRRRALGYDDEDSERASTLIRRNDSDGSRSLSKAELIASGADRNSPLSPVKLPVIDVNKSGSIDVHELARYLKKTRD